MQNPPDIREDFPSDLKLVNPFIDTVHRAVIGMQASQEDAFKIKLCLEEALTNAMRHGNKLDPSKRVSVAVRFSAGAIEMDVHDQGAGFDACLIPDPTSEKHRSAPSGRGVYLIRSMMDDVSFYDGGSGVRMKKTFRTAP